MALDDPFPGQGVSSILPLGADDLVPSGERSHLKASVLITVGGKDMTLAWDPHLISVVAIDKATNPPELDTCAIELDDRDANLLLPQMNDPVTARFGWNGKGMSTVFTGLVSEVESGFARKGGGRRLWVDALGANMTANGKTAELQSWGEGLKPGGGGADIPLSQVVGEVAGKAGLSMMVDPVLGAMTRKFWNQTESPHQFLARLGQEVGGIVKISGSKGAFVSGLGGLTGAGTSMGTIKAQWGDNLIAWRIKPFLAVPQFKSAASEFFDRLNGAYGKAKLPVAGSLPFGTASATAQPDAPAPGPAEGDQSNSAQDSSSQVDRTVGWALINGNPACLALKTLIVIGARPGIDGPYMISEAEHHYSREGYVTRCVLTNYNTTGGGFTLPSDRGYGHWNTKGNAP
jgi:Bacteriophage probable baseplate hub protein